MTKIPLSLMAGAFSLLALGCNTETGKLYGEPPTQTRKTEGSELQTFNPTVDIMFVIDDSGSMSTHQRNLQNNADLFTAGLQANKFVDYHIGVISTTAQYSSFNGSGGGALYGNKRYIERSTLNGLQELKENIMIGIGGSHWEVVFDPIRLALTDPMLNTQNKGFYRPSAHLAVIIITDAEDQSTRMNPLTTAQFLTDLKKGDSQKLLTYGVIVPSNDTMNCSRDETNGRPKRIEEFFNLTKGSFFNLCDIDYGAKLARIGADLVERVGRRVLLDRRPIINTVEVVYGSQVIPPDAETGWSFDASDNAIVLGKGILWTDQPQGTVVEVTFKPADAN